ncbi:universal stress protein [Aeromicrobium terrae]|uniref:UspA domain-containing protein n=1 Tax=Aeromicrobium terrae TaxID=2498846 RepID=A0A5C8NF10_9ACTN|nr:universal stress protein [Aeromicrobium terrae]TXL57493.1 hypothetical protein FHP06_14055 [Aeromicrobium terrae]
MSTRDTTGPVLVAVEADQPAVVTFAAQEAIRRGVPLIVLHAYGTADVVAGVVPSQALIAAAAEDAKNVLSDAESVVTRLSERPSTHYVAELGSAVEVIDAFVNDVQPQLLVLGTDDVSWFERAFGGAVARHLALHAACPVVVVPPVHDLSTLYGGVCVAIESDHTAAGPLRFAFETAAARHATLLVLHVVPEGLDTAETESGRRGLAEVLAGWRSEFPDVVVATRVAADDYVVASLADLSERSELMVVGRPRHADLFGRGVAYRLTTVAQCPLVVVDPAYGTTHAGAAGVRSAH